MEEITTERVVIIGAGLGALYAALNLAPRPVIVISPEVLGEGASSAWAQGGVAAAMDINDSPEKHALDTVRAGAGTVDINVADMVTNVAKDHILALTRMDTPFDRTEDGGYTLSREAAHSFARVVRVKGDQAGFEIMAALIKQVRQTPSIQVLEGTMAVELLKEGNRISGVVIEDANMPCSNQIRLTTSVVLLAGGGSGGLYALTTNPPRIRGQVIGMAARVGALIADAEFVQFHPTALNVGEDPAPLATEALRGEGAILVNKHGVRFMEPIHEDAELAPRDIVARAIFEQTQAGLNPMLDIRPIQGENVKMRYPALFEACARNNIDPIKAPVPVAAAAHYHMGGIATDTDGHASIKGLWVCGEASSTGLHGANRLASNGLLEALVYARICAQSIVAETPQIIESPQLDVSFEVSSEKHNDIEAMNQLRQTMTDFVGVLRNGDGLREALQQITVLEESQRTNISFINMCATATLIAVSALLREESRGAHERTDFPKTNKLAEKRSQIYLSEALDIRAEISQDTS
jgi:L-aspartate oxidase